MSYTYLLGPGEESSAESFSDIPACVLWRLNPTAAECCSSVSGMECCHASQSGTTCERSTGDLGGDGLTSCVAGFLARTFQPPVREPESTASGRDSGAKWPGSLARYDPDSRSWKTHQYSLAGDLEEFLETWPRWGSMRSGECWALPTPARPTCESGFGLWPTPRKQARRILHRPDYHSNIEEHLGRLHPSECGKLIAPRLLEWMMVWPADWTDLQPLAMDRFQQWRRSHGESSQGGDI